MQYSQLIGAASSSKFSNDSSLFIHHDGRDKLYVSLFVIQIKDCSLDMKNIGIISVPAPITQSLISSNSQYIAIFMQKRNLIQIYKIETKELIAKIQDSQAGISSLFWVPNSLQLMVFSEFLYKVSIYNLSLANMCYIKAPKFSTTKGFSFSKSGKFLALLQKHDCKDFLSIYYTLDWKLINTYQLDLFDAVEVKWSPNDSYISVADNCINYRIVVYSHLSGQVLKYEPYNFALGIKTFKFSNSSLFLAIGSFDEKIRIINALSWVQVGELDCSCSTIDTFKTIVHKQEQGIKNSNRMKVVEEKFFKIPTVKPIMNQQKGVPNQGISLIELSQDDSFIACKNDNMPFSVWIWDVSSMQPISLINCNSQIKGIKWTKKENHLCIITGTQRILFWKPNGTIAQCIFNFQNKIKICIQKIQWSNDGVKAIISDKNEIAYVELANDRVDIF